MPDPGGIGLKGVAPAEIVDRHTRVASALAENRIAFEGQHVEGHQIDAIVGQRPAEAEYAPGENRGLRFVLPQVAIRQTPEQQDRAQRSDGRQPHTSKISIA